MASARALTPIKQGDTKRRLVDRLSYEGAFINLSEDNVTSAKLAIKSVSAGTAVLRDATTKDSSGNITYQFVTDDVATAGAYDLEWQITFTDGKKLTIPGDGAYRMTILPKITASS